jgi:glutaminyl-peptide cyclotransferase
MRDRYGFRIAIPIAAAALLAAGCGRPGAPARPADATGGPVPGLALFSASNAWSEVEAFVALGPKPAFSVAASRAATHIESRLAAHGLSPAIDVFTDLTPNGPRILRNVIAELPGATGLVVLVSHYDTKAGISTNFAGANDSGSSTGLLIELARCLHNAGPLPVNVMIAFVDGEECLEAYGPRDGLHGSRRLAQRLTGRKQDVLGVIVLDMIGDRDLTVTIPRNSSASLMNLAFQAAHRAGVRDKFSIADAAVVDDHVPFLQAGIRAVDLIDFHYGSTRGANDYWHTDADTMDKLGQASLKSVGKVVLHMLGAIASTGEGDSARR